MWCWWSVHQTHLNSTVYVNWPNVWVKPPIWLIMQMNFNKSGLRNITKVGVTAGASAPEILIKQVIQRLQDWGATPPQELAGTGRKYYL